MPQDFNHIMKNFSVKPIFKQIKVNEIIAVVKLPIIRANATFCFILKRQLNITDAQEISMHF